MTRNACQYDMKHKLFHYFSSIPVEITRLKLKTYDCSCSTRYLGV